MGTIGDICLFSIIVMIFFIMAVNKEEIEDKWDELMNKRFRNKK